MKTIVAGSRSITDYETVADAIENCGWDVTGIVSGMAGGVDMLGVSYAFSKKLPLYKYPADWNRHGKAAGFIRNVDMAKNADALIAVWDGKSRGTKHMIKAAKKNGLQVHVVECQNKGRR